MLLRIVRVLTQLTHSA